MYDPDLLSLLDRIYEAKSNPALQSSTLQSIANLLKADACRVVSDESEKFMSLPGSTLKAKIGESLMVLVTSSKKTFTSQEKIVWRTIVHHLRRSLELQEKAERMSLDRSMIVKVLDCLPIGLVLANDGAKILIANRAANEILNQNDGLTVRRDLLIGSGRAETAALHKTILQVAGSETGNWISVSRLSDLRDYSLLLFPLAATLHDEGAGDYRMVVLVIADPEREVSVNQKTLKRIFQLSSGEAELVRHLLEGRDLSEAAEMLGISLNTAYDRLKAIFKKTSARRQSDLIRILLLSPAVLTA